MLSRAAEPYVACFIQHAVPTVAISQIQSDRQFLLGEISVLLCHWGANLLHCRSPFYLCREQDNLGAYTASRPETGLLIPSGYVKCLRQLPLWLDHAGGDS
jgi:hypothetical protein